MIPVTDNVPTDGLSSLLRPVRGRIVLGVVLQALAALASLATFGVIYLLALELTRDQVRHDVVWLVVAAAAGALVLRFTCQAMSYQLMHDADIDFQLVVRKRLAHRLSRVPLGWFTARNSATVKKSLADDVESVHYLVAHALPDLTVAVVTPLASLVTLVLLDWRLTLATLAPVPVFAVLFWSTQRRGGRQVERMSQAVAGVNTAVIEFVQGISVIKSFGQRDRADARFSRAVADYMASFTAVKGPILKLSSAAYAAVSPASMLASATIGGAVFVVLGMARPVDVLAFVLLGLALTAPLVIITYGPQAFARARHAADRIVALLATPELPEPDEPRVPDGHRVEFDTVTFGYDDQNSVLRDVSLVLEPGTCTALVGPSGAGKSTIATMLCRFFDPWRGAVRIGGADLREIPTDELYRIVTFVFQETGLLRISVADNIRLGRPGASMDEVCAAARSAQVHDRIMDLPRGYESVIGEDARLSGGEAQRVAIARALLADTPVLVLDEATACVDAEAEAAIYDALTRLVAGRTVLFVAHRLHTVVEADQILVVDDGTVVERGRHRELLAEGGLYARLWAAADSSADHADALAGGE
jgi:ATP-binding cassette, subfamily B, bacterial IrtA/YbtP